MPATAVTVNNLDHKTLIAKPAPVALDPVNGNRFINGGTLVLEFTASAGGTVTVSFPASAAVDGQAPAPITYTFTGAETRVGGGWPVAYYGSEVVLTGSVDTISVIAYQV